MMVLSIPMIGAAPRAALLNASSCQTLPPHSEPRTTLLLARRCARLSSRATGRRAGQRRTQHAEARRVGQAGRQKQKPFVSRERDEGLRCLPRYHSRWPPVLAARFTRPDQGVSASSDTVFLLTVEAPAVPTGAIACSVRDSGASFGAFQIARFQPGRASLSSSAYLLFPFTVCGVFN